MLLCIGGGACKSEGGGDVGRRWRGDGFLLGLVFVLVEVQEQEERYGLERIHDGQVSSVWRIGCSSARGRWPATRTINVHKIEEKAAWRDDHRLQDENITKHKFALVNVFMVKKEINNKNASFVLLSLFLCLL